MRPTVLRFCHRTISFRRSSSFVCLAVGPVDDTAAPTPEPPVPITVTTATVINKTGYQLVAECRIGPHRNYWRNQTTPARGICNRRRDPRVTHDSTHHTVCEQFMCAGGTVYSGWCFARRCWARLVPHIERGWQIGRA